VTDTVDEINTLLSARDLNPETRRTLEQVLTALLNELKDHETRLKQLENV